ncbi:MAG: DNA topoisomerase 3 [Paludibacteraceae bacterium]|nr:DNA topoisomerase 3 [Paludibacteraceae bacterium]
MTVCIAEKPSVGREIAKVLGANDRHDGYMEGNGWQVTWVFGHLCQLYEPHEYQEQWRRWSMDVLPMIPDRFRIRVSDNDGVQKQFEIIKNLCANADAVVNCGDAGQEGELIQRWVQQQAGVKCPIQRLWISSLTEDAIREGFQNLKPQSEYDRLYYAGLMRAIGDWLLGMNASRAYTLRYGAYKQTLSVGRVQTPTLALMAARQREIENFVPRTYWELKTVYRETVFSAIMAKDDEENPEAGSKPVQQEQGTKHQEEWNFVPLPPIQSVEEGEALVSRLKEKPLTILDVQKKPGKEYAPKLFDLTSLQVECNKKFGFTAENTLNLIQSLYEKKITTYPRVDTTYLSDDIYPKVRGTLQGIGGGDYYGKLVAPLLGMSSLPKSKRVFDNSKVTDHHAIIPTGVPPNALTADERKVFDLVARRFIAAFYPECKISTTTVLAEADRVGFRVSGKQIIEPGWRVVFDKDKNKDEEERADEREKTLPSFVKGESGPHDPQLAEKQTTPPKPYTEATLLRAMETAGKTVDDEELRAMMKENGIGRPSTRASIIETLFKRQYIIRGNKSLSVTTLGLKLIDSIQTELLKSAELTGLWEKKLRQIESGGYEPKQFMEELKRLALEVVTDLRYVGLSCPTCRQGTVVKGKHAYGCSNWRSGCQYRVQFPWE